MGGHLGSESVATMHRIMQYRGPLPAYEEFMGTVFFKTRKFSNLANLFASGARWHEKLKSFAAYKINEPPTYTEDYYLNNFYYEAVKLLYLIYMNAGFSQQSCNALFLQHMAFLNKLGIFGIYGDFDFTYGPLEDSAGYDEGFYYDRSRDRLVSYFRLTGVMNQKSKMIRFRFSNEDFLKGALKRTRKNSQEHAALQAYLEGCRVDKLHPEIVGDKNEGE